MADVERAIQFVLRQEDSRMSGVITNNPDDHGGRTRFGIAEHAHPELTASGFFDTMPYGEALSTAIGVYQQKYAQPLRLALIESQGVATALLSFAVVEGVISSIRFAQRACGVTEDGVFGPLTLQAVNRMPDMLTRLVEMQKQHFIVIAESNTTQNRFLAGWENRADALLALA